MTRNEEQIWCAAFSAYLSAHADREQARQARGLSQRCVPRSADGMRPVGVRLGLHLPTAYKYAFRQVLIYREDTRDLTDEEALSMYREMRGQDESERVHIQKETIRGLISYIEGRIENITQYHPNHDYEWQKLKNAPVVEELRQLVCELQSTMKTNTEDG